MLANRACFGRVRKVFEMCGRVVCGVFLIAAPVECQTSKIAVAPRLTSQSSSKTAETPTVTVGPNGRSQPR